MIRFAQSDDAIQIHTLLVDTIPGTHPHDAQWIVDRLSANTSLIVIDTRRGDVVGALVGTVVLDEAEIHDVAVTPRFRRQGRAANLVLDFEYRASKRGAVQAFLEVRASNEPAKRLYKKAGYRMQHTRKQYYPDGEDALILRKDLVPST